MQARRLLAVIFALGLYLTLRGYHSRDGDQAYRLPLLLHRQDPAVFANDPFVRAFDEFNPHQGSLALLDGLSRVTGLSTALFLMFSATFVVTVFAVDRLARAVWPDSRASVGVIAVALLLMAKAGNLGTNHLFEAMLLDRLMAYALGWLAIGGLIADPERSRVSTALLIAGAAFIHPSLGLQIGLLTIAGWLVFPLLRRWCGVSWRTALGGVSFTLLALLPSFWMMAAQGNRLFAGLSPSDFFALSASVQSPQHMLPHLWRLPQWLAAGCYLVVSGVSLFDGSGKPSGGRARLLILLATILLGLIAATIAIERFGSIRVTVFQPFRMATVARGLCLVLMSEHVRSLWNRGVRLSRIRCAVLVAGLTGDWAFVAATLFDASAFLCERFARRIEVAVSITMLVGSLVFLSRHDTEFGHVLLISAIAAALVASYLSKSPFKSPHGFRLAVCLALAWIVPVAAMIVPALSNGPLSQNLASRCRFGEWADDDIERLAVWCRYHTPKDARFVGPPGPKTFRLWSRRDLAFNRAASPYHGSGLADWSKRFREHVGFRGTIADFAIAYLTDRLALERGFDRMNATELAALASQQGANYLLASSKLDAGSCLERIRVEGRFAIYRIIPNQLSAKITSSRARM